MKTRIDYWHDGQRYPIKLTGYGHDLLAKAGGSPSTAITLALQAFLNNPDPMAAATAFIAAHAGMNLSVLVEIALSRHLDH